MPHAREDVSCHAYCGLDGWVALLPDKGNFLGDQLDLERYAEPPPFHLRYYPVDESKSFFVLVEIHLQQHWIRYGFQSPDQRTKSEALVGKMETLGFALVVGGAAFLCSGLISLLPLERRRTSATKSFQENREEIENHLQYFRSERGEY